MDEDSASFVIFMQTCEALLPFLCLRMTRNILRTWPYEFREVSSVLIEHTLQQAVFQLCLRICQTLLMPLLQLSHRVASDGIANGLKTEAWAADTRETDQIECHRLITSLRAASKQFSMDEVHAI